MPFANNKDLPKNIRDALPEKAQNIWRETFNSIFYDGDGEESAIKGAWSAVKNAGFNKDDSGKWALKKSKSFKPTKSMQDAAKRGLELREKYGRGGLSTKEAGKQGIKSGVARARDIVDGDNLSLETVKAMRAFFERHEKNKNTPPEEGNGKISWLLWGGDPGRTWANKILRQENIIKTDEIFEVFPDVEETPSPENIFKAQCEVTDVDSNLGIVFGWGMVTDIDGQPYYDLDDLHINSEIMVKATSQFMEGQRTSNDMHTSEDIGIVVHSFPLSKDIAKAMGVNSRISGWMVGVKPSKDLLEKFMSGEYTGFSIEGEGELIDIE